MLCSWFAVSAQSSQPTVPDSIGRVSINFRINRWDIDSTYANNARSLRDLRSLLDGVKATPPISVDSVNVSICTSPDGIPNKNRELSLRRLATMRTFLNTSCGIPDSIVTYTYSSMPWDMFRTLVAASDHPWRHEALDILNTGSDSSDTDNIRRINALKALDNGHAWPVFAADILPKLRGSLIISYFTSSSPAQYPDVLEPPEPPVCTAPVDIPAPANDIPAPASAPKPYDRFAIKTNAAYLAAGVANIGAEMALSDHWSIDLPLVYSPYTIARDYRMRFLYIQPEARYWLDKPLKGHFFGIHAHIGVANISLDDNHRYQTPDGFYGAGISYGFSLPIARRWSLEFTLGLGYFYTEYDSYYNIGIPQGMRYEKDHPLNYWGIDKVGINIVYRFGDKSCKRKEVAEP